MRHATIIVLLLVGGYIAWRIGESLSSDAISMGLGIFFGMMAGIPASLLVLAASRRGERYEDERPQMRNMNEAGPYGHQPPVIVLAGMGGMNGMGQQALLPQQSGASASMQPYLDYAAMSQTRTAREYRIVGEREESVEDW